MPFRSRITDSLQHALGGLRDEIARWHAEGARRKSEWRWKRTKQRVRAARAYCENKLHDQLWDEHLQQVMKARIRDAKLPGIGESRIHWLQRDGIKTAYDVHRTGVGGLMAVYSIGPTIAESLVEWADAYVPKSWSVDRKSREYFLRLRALKRQHLGMQAHR